MKAVPVLPNRQTFFSPSFLLPAPHLPTYSPIVSIHTLHETCTFSLLALRQRGPSRAPNSCDSMAVRTRWYITDQACWCRCPHIIHFLMADVGFLASCRSQLSWARVALCALWKVLYAVASKGWVPCKCPWEVEATHLLTSLNYRTSPPYSIPEYLVEELDLPLTFHVMNVFSRAHRNRARRGKYIFHLSWRPKSFLETHQSVPLFFRCWAQQSKKRNSYLGYRLSLPSSYGSRPATNCQPPKRSLILFGVEYAGTSQSRDWGTVTHQHYMDSHSQMSLGL